MHCLLRKVKRKKLFVMKGEGFEKARGVNE